MCFLNLPLFLYSRFPNSTSSRFHNFQVTFFSDEKSTLFSVPVSFQFNAASPPAWRKAACSRGKVCSLTPIYPPSPWVGGIGGLGICGLPQRCSQLLSSQEQMNIWVIWLLTRYFVGCDYLSFPPQLAMDNHCMAGQQHALSWVCILGRAQQLLYCPSSLTWDIRTWLKLSHNWLLGSLLGRLQAPLCIIRAELIKSSFLPLCSPQGNLTWLCHTKQLLLFCLHFAISLPCQLYLAHLPCSPTWSAVL